MTVASPCIRICSIDPTTGHCVGCGRSRREIAGWNRMTEDQRELLVSTLETRPKGMAQETLPAAIVMDCATCGACSGRERQAPRQAEPTLRP
jgi:uncharacterized protein